jgi:hypothetical protein
MTIGFDLPRVGFDLATATLVGITRATARRAIAFFILRLSLGFRISVREQIVQPVRQLLHNVV